MMETYSWKGSVSLVSSIGVVVIVASILVDAWQLGVVMEEGTIAEIENLEAINL
jgi:hypothetical protein